MVDGAWVEKIWFSGSVETAFQKFSMEPRIHHLLEEGSAKVEKTRPILTKNVVK